MCYPSKIKKALHFCKALINSSERERIRTFDRLLRRQMLYPAELRTHCVKHKNSKRNFLSGWQDSNLRPPGPKPGAMTGLRYTPRFLCGGYEIRTHATLSRRQFSKLLR